MFRDVTAELWEQDVIPDFRAPQGIRIGLSPLSTSFDEVRRGMWAIRERLEGRGFDNPRGMPVN
ncbi:Kynureninase [compost metagenome]